VSAGVQSEREVESNMQS